MAKDVAVHVTNVSDVKHAYFHGLKIRSPDGLPTGHVGVKDGHSAQQIVDAIQKVSSGYQIKVMRILSHGNAGQLAFPNLGDAWSISSKFKQLRPRFAPLARLELHGCGVASETNVLKPGVIKPRNRDDCVPGRFTGDPDGDGITFLFAIARTFNVITIGAVDIQFADESWSYDGVTVSITPAGKFRVQKEGERAWDFEATKRAAKREFERIGRDYVDKKLYQQARAAYRILIKQFPTTAEAEIARLRLEPDFLETLEREKKPAPWSER